MVDAQPVRDHVNKLRAQGMGYRAIADASGVSLSTVYSLVNGIPDRAGGHRKTNRMRAYPARLLLKTHAAAARVNPIGAVRRLRALVAIGHTLIVIAEHTGMHVDNIGAITRGDTRYITARCEQAIRDAFETLSVRPGPGPGNFGATLARRRAAAAGWAPPLAWDDNIDDPDAQPEGVRTAADDRPAQGIDLAEVRHLHEGGVTAAQIAARLDVSEDTVKQRLSEIRRGKRKAA